jgi:hypothetical protein
MKTLFQSIANFIKKQWFLLVMVAAIAIIIILFEKL